MIEQISHGHKGSCVTNGSRAKGSCDSDGVGPGNQTSMVSEGLPEREKYGEAAFVLTISCIASNSYNGISWFRMKARWQ